MCIALIDVIHRGFAVLPILCACIASISLFSEGWMQNYEKAHVHAQQTDKPLLVAVLGSSLCPWSQRFQEEIVACPEFLDALEGHFVCAAARQEQIPQFTGDIPCILIQSPYGEEIARRTYLPIDSTRYGRLCLESARIFEKCKKLPLETLPENILEPLYKEAVNASCIDLSQHILSIAMQQGRMLFAVFEEYKCLVMAGKRKKDRALRLREELLGRDPRNIRGMWFQIAYLDFFDRDSKARELKDVLEPLVRYIDMFTKVQDPYLWQAEMIASEYLFVHGHAHKAIKYAKKALQKAPLEHKERVIAALAYMEGAK